MQLGLPSGWNVTASLPVYQLALSYNDANQVTTTSATAGPASYSFTQIYDGTTGSLQGLSSGSSGGSPNLASLAYNEYAQISQITDLNGSSTQIASVQYSYDGNLRPTSLTANWLPGSGQSGQILGQARSYDHAGNVIGLTTTLAAVPGQNNSGGTETQNFCYDEQNRLVWSGNGGTQPGAGNGTCGTGTLGNTLSGAGYTAPYQYTNLGQIWQGPLNGQGANQQYLSCDANHPHQLSGLYPVGTTCANRSGAVYTAGYDAWGNETSRSTGGVTATLSYDALNRLVGYNAGSNGQEWYLSNSTGERILKRSLSGSTTTLTVYAFGLQELSYSGSGAFTNQIDYYALAGHLIGSTNGTTTIYYLTDAQGSVLTSLSTSAIVGQQVYGPYGNTRYQVGAMGTTKGYTGQFHDAVSGLDYYHARYYDPVVGQFVSVDVVQGNAQGYDPYAYVGGNPLTFTDSDGHAPDPHRCGDNLTPQERAQLVFLEVVLLVCLIESLGAGSAAAAKGIPNPPGGGSQKTISTQTPPLPNANDWGGGPDSAQTPPGKSDGSTDQGDPLNGENTDVQLPTPKGSGGGSSPKPPRSGPRIKAQKVKQDSTKGKTKNNHWINITDIIEAVQATRLGPKVVVGVETPILPVRKGSPVISEGQVHDAPVPWYQRVWTLIGTSAGEVPEGVPDLPVVPVPVI